MAPQAHAKRRLTHRDFLLRYRQVLRAGGEIHFKTDNVGLFAFSVTEFPLGGFYPEQVTHDLHARHPGIMTDYEEKFHNMGTKINRCVAAERGSSPPACTGGEHSGGVRRRPKRDEKPHRFERVSLAGGVAF